ncbi:DUF423 domain-containing protein [Waterburya agarophytonicola K14]|uniref:DUF423 domain-containing protein n=1 Tax=Waterburya agarophytonicola KI4 TaxID=2874699 RepID=A0A964FLE8_9CYAN|nr:DUF423 domain-containing protein [Waterburya agarophytonicola KI4]
MSRIFLAIAASLGGISVILGAFASHALKDRLSDRALEIWETGTKYQMYHALALILVALLLERMAVGSTSLFLVIAGSAFIVGIILFSGSLYALSLSGIKILGAVTPLGGVAFITGWICLAIAALNMD